MMISTPKSIRFAIGPEGGWSEKERNLFEQHRFSGVGMAPYILRVETAATGAMALLRNL
jgi:16S rRNA (uracil1498-N3)-methyltransferase